MVHPQFGYNFRWKGWALSPQVGFLYRDRQWSAVNGYLQYPKSGEPWTGAVEKQPMEGTVISYETSAFMPSLSLNLGYTFGQGLGITLEGSWYPTMEVTALDNHYVRLTQFATTMQGGQGFHFDLTFRYYPAALEGLGFLLSGGYEGLFPNTGSINFGNLGDDTGLTENQRETANQKSNLFWIALGVSIHPGRIWKK
jgi:outer membrane protease